VRGHHWAKSTNRVAAKPRAYARSPVPSGIAALITAIASMMPSRSALARGRSSSKRLV
jgi:hypothetical protein